MASKLRVDSILPVDGAPTGGGGGIIQVVTGSSSTRVTAPTNTGSYYNSYVNATITPKFSTSKILIVGNGDVQCQADTTGSVAFARNVTNADAELTNGTLLGATSSNGIINFRFSSAFENIPLTVMHLDSPSSTSATKYTVVLGRTSGSNNIKLPGNDGGNPFTIYLFEVSA